MIPGAVVACRPSSERLRHRVGYVPLSTGGDRSQLPSGFRDTLLAAGYAVATVDYRLAQLLDNKWPTGLLDSKLAVKYLETFAGQLGWILHGSSPPVTPPAATWR